MQLRPRRAVLDQLRDVEAQLADALVLHDLTVQTRRQCQLARIRDFLGGDEPRTERAAVMEVLAGRELLRVPLEVAEAAVVEARVARDVIERLLLANPARAFADHDRKLAFVVELYGRRRQQQRLAMAHDAVVKAHE